MAILEAHTCMTAKRRVFSTTISDILFREIFLVVELLINALSLM